MGATSPAATNVAAFFTLLPIIILLISGTCWADDQQLGPLDCYRTSGYALGVEQVRCAASLPGSPTYCLKADVYDGRVVRDCASAAQCPQGEGCAPITYDEDGTTDFVCCCTSDLCNSAKESARNFVIILMPILVILLLAKFGTQIAI
uniref:Protein sleepless n=1 Tax=Globodera rostochiensis TaxID=31243 RepID=A0A914IFI1_GLORO